VALLTSAAQSSPPVLTGVLLARDAHASSGHPGENVEAGSDPVAGSLVRYARAIRVAASMAPPRKPAG
jgi:hypothetical protein